MLHTDSLSLRSTNFREIIYNRSGGRRNRGNSFSPFKCRKSNRSVGRVSDVLYGVLLVYVPLIPVLEF